MTAIAQVAAAASRNRAAAGPTYYVATTGNDSTGDGSIGNPWLTPAYGASQLTVDGSTLYIRAGIYNVSTVQSHGSTPQPTIYPRAYNCTIATYPSDAARSAVLYGGLEGATYGRSPTGGVIGSKGKGGTIIDNLTIVGMVIFEGETTRATRSTLRNCDVSIGGDGNGGMYQGNVVLCNHGANHIHIYNNRIHHGNGLIAVTGLQYDGGGGGTGVMCYGVSDVLIEQNTIYSHGTLGIMFKDDTENCVANRNFIYENGLTGIWFGNNPSATYTKSGDIYQNIIARNNWKNDDGAGGLRFIYEENLFNVYNNTLHGNLHAELRHAGFEGGTLVPPIPYTYFNNIVSATGSYLNYQNSYSTYYVPSMNYMDYNLYVNEANGWMHAYANSFATLATWKAWLQGVGTSYSGASLATAENNSTTGTANFLNASGQFVLATDFKRSSYPSIGRGGSWPSVMGAYTSGSDQIGADWGVGPVYYVSTTGNNGNDGSFSSPWRTPEYGASQLTQPYSKLYIRGGTYDVATNTAFQNDVIYPRASYCTISGYPGETAIIRGGTGGANYGVPPTNWLIGTHYHAQGRIGLVIENLTIQGIVMLGGGIGCVVRHCDVSKGTDSSTGNGQGSVIWVQGDRPTSGTPASGENQYCRIENCKVHDNAWGPETSQPGNAPLIMVYCASNLIIENCELYASAGTGITVKDIVSNITIRRNFIHDNAGHGIHFGGNAYTVVSPSAEIYQNIIANNNSLGTDQVGGFATLNNEGTFKFYNNTLHRNYVHDIAKSYAGGSNWECFNNLVYASRGHYFAAPYTGNGVAEITYFDYNGYYGGTSGWKQAGVTYAANDIAGWKAYVNGVIAGNESHSVNTDPGFLNAGGSWALATDYKRSSYTTNGRGGNTFSTVMGAYTKSTETIGTDW